MKKQFYLLAAGLFTVCIANAQIKKGDLLLGGGISFNKQNFKPDGAGTNATSISVSPSFGIATSDNFVVGFNLSYGNYKTDNTVYPVQKTNSYGAGFFVRRYKPLGNGFSLFGEGNFMGSYAVLKNVYGTIPNQVNETKSYNLTLGFYPGVAYAISRHAQLETGFQNLAYAQYGHMKTTTPGVAEDARSNSYSLGTSFSSNLGGFTVGIRWLL